MFVIGDYATNMTLSLLTVLQSENFNNLILFALFLSKNNSE